MQNIGLLPEQASTVAPLIDTLYLVLIAMSAFFTLIVTFFIVYFAAKYRRGSRADRSNPVHSSMPLELSWSIIPLILGLGLFVWAAAVYFNVSRLPTRDAIEISAIGKQWMWKFQHPDGRREINNLHVPTGRPVKLTLTSQDVIHSFFVPAFRVKRDVLPGRYSTTWFEATKPGKYHLFCAEYCGTEHSLMGGWVTVMEPTEYQEWLTSGNVGSETMEQAGERLFASLGCVTCHGLRTVVRAPKLDNLFGSRVQMKSGETVTADEQYLRESILRSTAKVVAGYEPIMPIFEGQVSEEELAQLIAYIKSLSQGTGAAGAPAAAGAVQEVSAPQTAPSDAGGQPAPTTPVDAGTTPPPTAPTSTTEGM